MRYLVIIDMQEDMFLNPDKSSLKQATDTAVSLIRSFKSKNEKILVILSEKSERAKKSKFSEWFISGSFPDKATLLKDIDDELDASSTKIIKNGVSAITSREFKKLIKIIKNENNEKNQFYLIGGFAKQCVFKTAKGMKRKGIEIMVVEKGLVLDKKDTFDQIRKKYEKSGICLVKDLI